MILRREQRAIIVLSIIVSSVLFSAALEAQTAPTGAQPAMIPLTTSMPFLASSSLSTSFLPKSPLISTPSAFVAHSAPLGSTLSVTPPRGLPHRITLEEAQQAAAANNPMARLAELGVEAAHQHRLGAEADYLPKISALATNVHFNKFMGVELTVQRPLQGQTSTVQVPLVGKDQTLVSVSGAQPITPLLKVRQGVNVARADERLAKSKAGVPVEAADNVEQDYYELLVAQREFHIARANAERISNKRLVASVAPTAASTSDSPENSGAEKELVLVESKVIELTASLNRLMGLPEDTELELAVPVTDSEEISRKEVTDAATAANPDVVEAEGNLAKARAGQRLAKLDYIPDVAVLGGYVYNGNAIPPLPRDFSYIGLLGSWNVFDFGKREHTIKERNAQVSMAETALQLTKAKVAAAVNSNYSDMERSRQLSELAHRLNEAIPIERAVHSGDNTELTITRAKIEIEMLQADLAYRKSIAQLKTLMGKR